MYVQGPLAAGNVNQLDSATHSDQDDVVELLLVTDTRPTANRGALKSVKVPFTCFTMKLYCEEWFSMSDFGF